MSIDHVSEIWRWPGHPNVWSVVPDLMHQFLLGILRDTMENLMANVFGNPFLNGFLFN
jgi:hypothetical protein